MVAPAEFFGSNSDGSMRMERWLDRMCRDCVHGETIDGTAGMGCELPANAYVEPYVDIVEWSTDAARIPTGLMGLMCMRHEPRPVPVGPIEQRPEVPGQMALGGC